MSFGFSIKGIYFREQAESGRMLLYQTLTSNGLHSTRLPPSVPEVLSFETHVIPTLPPAWGKHSLSITIKKS